MAKKKKAFFLIIVVLLIAAAVIIKMRRKPNEDELLKEISPTIGPIQTVISTTGTVLPKNRLAIKPPVPGRVEEVLVKEGQEVVVGQILAWMSSTERAALLDAAQGKGGKELKYWKETYKPIALLAPIAGEVIVATVQPGQAVTTADAVVVLSDQLIVRAQVDETDIGKIKLAQKAIISLDAYADIKIKAVVEHIYYESKTVNNVTIYEVDLIPAEVPAFFRSGMNTTIDFIENSRDMALLLPLEAIYKEKEESFVFLKQNDGKEPALRAVKLGINDGKNTEIISGIGSKDIIVIKSKKYVLPKSNNTGTNPFMPSRRGTGRGSAAH
ncbi:MAG: HlyD family efflux transporter periplasmic adaptor subunit [Candidatus Omnitrophota bacterium]